jgi:hypothetical protein
MQEHFCHIFETLWDSNYVIFKIYCLPCLQTKNLHLGISSSILLFWFLYFFLNNTTIYTYQTVIFQVLFVLLTTHAHVSSWSHTTQYIVLAKEILFNACICQVGQVWTLNIFMFSIIYVNCVDYFTYITNIQSEKNASPTLHFILDHIEFLIKTYDYRIFLSWPVRFNFRGQSDIWMWVFMHTWVDSFQIYFHFL